MNCPSSQFIGQIGELQLGLCTDSGIFLNLRSVIGIFDCELLITILVDLDPLAISVLEINVILDTVIAPENRFQTILFK